MNKSRALSRFEAFRTSRFWFTCADILAMLLVAALPWSTTAFLIFLAPLLAIICGSVNVGVFARSLRRSASFVSVALFILAISGLIWSEVDFSAGLHSLGPLVKFLILPFLLYYFELSKRGMWVIGAFLFSCVVLLINSWVIIFEPNLAFKTGRCCGEDYGVSVRNYIDQSQEFGICLVGLSSAALFCIQKKMWRRGALLFATAMVFAANLMFVVVSRTAIVCVPLMILVLGWRHWKMSGILSAIAIGVVVFAAGWSASPRLRDRVSSTYSQFEEYRDHGVPSSVGKRLEFWHKSLVFFHDAPLFGHGTGSILKLFEKAAVGQSTASAEVIANPHNQIFSVLIQWGVVGLMVLFALWFVHLRMFLRHGLIAELGLLLVVQNVTGSLFNSHLFDFTEGWLYVLGVAVVGGIIARRGNLDKGSDCEAERPIAK